MEEKSLEFVCLICGLIFRFHKQSQVDMLQYHVRAHAVQLDQERAKFAEANATIAQLQTELRKIMWLSHGHVGLYGDDGEMQCGQCAQYGCWDYRNSALEAVRNAYGIARMELAARLNLPKEQP